MGTKSSKPKTWKRRKRFDRGDGSRIMTTIPSRRPSTRKKKRRKRKREKKRANSEVVIMVIKTSKCQQLMGHACQSWTRKMRKKKLKIKTYGPSDSKPNVKSLKPTSPRPLCRQ